MKVLFVATVTGGHIKAFHLPYMKWFREQGWEVHVATKGKDEIEFCDKKHDIPVQRSPFRFGNVRAYFELKKIIEREKYDLVHCHTPMGGILGRLSSRKRRKNGMKVLYTAHGFHFHKGAPLLNWMLYYPMEKICSRMADGLITINQEDYALAKKKMHTKRIYYIPGIGVDTAKFAGTVVDREKKRIELGIPDDAVMLLSVGELNSNKNHEVIIRAVAKLGNPDIHYCIAGQGEIREYLEKLAESLKLGSNVHFLGYRTDVNELYKCADIFCFPSKREGLPVALMEAMASGLPCVVSNIRGDTDLIEDSRGGIRCSAGSVDAYTNAIDRLIQDKGVREKMGEYNKGAVKRFDISNAMSEMIKIYREFML